MSGSNLANSFRELQQGTLRSFSQDLLRFQNKHRRNENVGLEPLYAMSTELFECVAQYLPHWLSDDEMAFERDLTMLCDRHFAVGIQFGLPVLHSFFQRATLPQITPKEFAALGWGGYTTLDRANSGLEQIAERAEPVKDRLEAYVGWLTLAPTFRKHNPLRQRWGDAIARSKSFPSSPVTVDFAETPTPQHTGRDVTLEFVREVNAFYQRWHLRRLATWDLPEPLGMNLGGPAFLSRHLGLDQQSAIQVSPVISLPVRYPVREILDEGTDDSEHLAEWHAVSDHQVQRYQRAFWLQFYRDTVLASRYSSRFAGHIEQLDELFAEYFGGLSADAIKKLRLSLPPRA